jgi:hypothetical protein
MSSIQSRSPNPPAECAAWATGLLRGSGMALLHQDALWQVFDRWMSELSAPVFVEMMPLVRRALAGFTVPERRQALYDPDRSAGLGSSCPNVNRWLGDIRTYFPKSVVQVMQKDALDRLHLQQMLLEPETLEPVEADIHLVGTLLSSDDHDPVEVLFGTPLRSGTDINRAVTYCRQHITRPSQTIFILRSDLYEG